MLAGAAPDPRKMITLSSGVSGENVTEPDLAVKGERETRIRPEIALEQLDLRLERASAAAHRTGIDPRGTRLRAGDLLTGSP